MSRKIGIYFTYSVSYSIFVYTLKIVHFLFRLSWDSLSCFISLVLALLIAKHQLRETLNISPTLGLWAAILQFAGRLREVQSSKNWVRKFPCSLIFKMSQVECTLKTALRSSGNILPWMSLVALHLVNTCSIDSSGAEQSLHWGLEPLSMKSLSAVR